MKVAGNYPGVSPDWVKQQIDKNTGMVLIDSRPKRTKYDKGHIPTAISIPDSEFDKLTAQLPADKNAILVFYCEGLKCRLSHKSAKKAIELGYTNVNVFAEGYPADDSFQQGMIDQAVEAARSAEGALVFAALPGFKESEGYDRVDLDLTDGQTYCYKVTAYDATCESGFSNILCAIPTNQGQATDPAGVSTMETGICTGKGKTRTCTFPSNVGNAGDDVVIRATVLDGVTGLPVADATVDLLITGPESLTLVTGPSDATGMAEATWQTKAPGRKNPGTTPGSYTVQIANVTATGYHWDGVQTSTTFTIQ